MNHPFILHESCLAISCNSSTFLENYLAISLVLVFIDLPSLIFIYENALHLFAAINIFASQKIQKHVFFLLPYKQLGRVGKNRISKSSHAPKTEHLILNE